MQKIIPCLWFDDDAEYAVNLYTSTFKNSELSYVSYYDEANAEASGRPEGSVLTIEFELEGCNFVALNGGPVFKFTPAVSFFINCSTEDEIDEIYDKLSEDGAILMPLQKYPFSEKYSWVQDKYGLSWQLSLAEGSPKITPSLLFVGDQFGRAEEAMNFYTSLFENSGINTIALYEPGEGGEVGKVKYASFTLDGNTFNAMESNLDHQYTFTPAVSFLVNCKDQEEVDMFWEELSRGGEKSVCGWLQDQYGVSWQIVPTILDEMLKDEDPEKAQRVMKAMLKMTKIEIEGLKEAYEVN